MNAAIAVLVAQLVALGLLGVLLIRRAAYRIAPVFVSYVAYAIAANLAQLIFLDEPAVYFKVFWIGEAGLLLFAIGSTYEAFLHTFRGYFILPWFRWLLPAVAAGVIFYAAWKAVARPPVRTSLFISVAIGTEVAVQYFVLATFLCFAVLVRALKVSYSGFQYGIAAGFGVTALGMLGASLLRSEFGTKFLWPITWLPAVAYFMALLIWIITSLTPLKDEIHGAHGITAASALEQLRQYESTLKKGG